jgi:hypothetical protein
MPILDVKKIKFNKKIGQDNFVNKKSLILVRNLVSNIYGGKILSTEKS